MTPGMTNYIGELNRPMSDILCSIMARGLLRLEGFAMRLHPDAVSPVQLSITSLYRTSR